MSAEGEVREKQTAMVGRGSVPLEHRLALSEVPLFQTLGKRHLRRVAKLAELRTYYGATVCRAGTRGDALYIVLDGTADVETPQGGVTRLEAGDAFGELALIDEAPRAATVTAAGQLTVARSSSTVAPRHARPSVASASSLQVTSSASWRCSTAPLARPASSRSTT